MIDRLVDEATIPFEYEQLEREIVAFDWRFGSENGGARWSVEGFGGQHELQAGKLLVRAPGTVGRLERDVALDAEAIEFIELESLGNRQHRLSLWFNRPGETFVPERRMALQPIVGSQPHRFRADMSVHGAWRGPIERIALVAELVEGSKLALLRIRGFERERSAELVTAASRRAHKLTLAGETRSARLALTGQDFEHRFTVPEGGLLEGASGTWRGAPATFTIELELDDGSRRALLEERLEPGLEPTPDASSVSMESTETPPARERELPWRPFSIDLSQYAGRSVILRFDVRDVAPQGLAFWGDLRLLGTMKRTAPHPDVLLVVLDTLRADRLSLYGHSRQTSPRLDAWAEEHAVVFGSVVAPAPWTMPSHTSLFTGLDTLSHGHHSTAGVPAELETLGERLQDAGWETLAATGGGYLSPDFGYAQGFDRFYADPSGGASDEGDLPANLARVEAWLSEDETSPARAPRFAFLHTYEIHTPYRFRQPFYRRLTGLEGDPEWISRLTTTTRIADGETAGAVVRKAFRIDDPETGPRPITTEELEAVRGAYDSGIAFVDHLLGDLLERLARRERPTLVIVTSDHGEALGEHGLSDHAYLYDFNLLVPLVIAFPEGLGAGRRIDRQVRLVDIFPTVLDALGLEGARAIDGRSLIPLVDGSDTEHPRTAWSATAKQGISLRTDNRQKYVVNTTRFGNAAAAESLFDLERDPGETDNLAAEEPHALETLRRGVRERYFEDLQGTLLVLSNDTSTPARFTLETDLTLNIDDVRSFERPSPDFVSPQVGNLEIEIPPQRRFTLAVERLTPRHLSALSFWRDGERCLVALEETPTPGASLRFGGDCRRRDREGEGGVEATLLFTAVASSETTERRGLSEETADRLRALGYLD